MGVLCSCCILISLPLVDPVSLMCFLQRDATAGANADFQYIKNTMDYIYNLGVARDKLVLGLAAYGRSMTLSSTSCTTDGCSVSGAGLVGCHGEFRVLHR